jgi:hypothetical protein
MCDEWKEAVNKTLVNGAALLDLKKAFDLRPEGEWIFDVYWYLHFY